MRTSLAILAAAAIGIGGAAVSAPPASAEMLHHLTYDAASTSSLAVQEVGYRTRGYYPRRHAYRHHYPRRTFRHRDRGSAAAAGIIGFGAGALLGHALTQPRTHYQAYAGLPPAHVQWCQQRYRSYDIGSDTFLSYDGNRYHCNSPYVAR